MRVIEETTGEGSLRNSQTARKIITNRHHSRMERKEKKQHVPVGGGSKKAGAELEEPE